MASMFCLADADTAAVWPAATATRSPTGAPGTNVLARLPISRASCWPSLPLNSFADTSRSYNDSESDASQTVPYMLAYKLTTIPAAENVAKISDVSISR